MLILKTIPGNLLVHFINNKKVFIYMDKYGNYLATDFETRNGLPINEMEWNNLKSKSKQEPREATVIELAQAPKAVNVRKEILRLKTEAERLDWADKNCPGRETKRKAA